MPLGTYLMNSTRKERIYLGDKYPDELSKYLLLLEKICHWNLRHDYIYVLHSENNFNYKDMKDIIYQKDSYNIR